MSGASSAKPDNAGNSWGVVFRVPQIIDGKPQDGSTLHGIGRMVLRDGWMVFDDTAGKTVYAIPADMVAYATDLGFAVKSDVMGILRKQLGAALQAAAPKGEA